MTKKKENLKEKQKDQRTRREKREGGMYMIARAIVPPIDRMKDMPDIAFAKSAGGVLGSEYEKMRTNDRWKQGHTQSTEHTSFG